MMRPLRAGRLTVRPRSSRTVILDWGGVELRPEAQSEPAGSVDSVDKDDLVDSAVKDGLVVADVADVKDEMARVRTMATL
jgi:hypothetical protein